jgi:putative flippase GtrA
LSDTLAGVDAVHLDRKGRGRALRAAWTRNTAAVVAYMDVDLATDLRALLPLVAPLVAGHSDISTGTRLAPGAHVVRGVGRELLSRGYNLLVRTALGSSCSDVQCGFKAMRRETAAELLPLVEDDEWFFDTELLVVAERIGLRIHEVPVNWVDDTDSRVNVLQTAWKDLRGVGRLALFGARRVARPGARRRPISRPTGPNTDGRARWKNRFLVGSAVESVGTGSADRNLPTSTAGNQVFADELLHFAGVGALSTVAYLTLVYALQTGLDIYLANLVAVVACSLGNTAIHHRMTRANGIGTPRRLQVTVGAGLMTVSLAGTSAALAGTRALGMTTLGLELVALTVANLAAAVVRFGILRRWIFPPRFGTSPESVHPAREVRRRASETERTEREAKDGQQTRIRTVKDP